jgi:hypothetical protein
MNNIFEKIAIMRKGMRAIGRTTEEVEKATEDVTGAEDYEEALERIKKYWR